MLNGQKKAGEAVAKLVLNVANQDIWQEIALKLDEGEDRTLALEAEVRVVDLIHALTLARVQEGDLTPEEDQTRGTGIAVVAALVLILDLIEEAQAETKEKTKTTKKNQKKRKRGKMTIQKVKRALKSP